MIKILIADDHPMIRQGLKQTVSDEPDMEIAGEAQNAQEALDLVRQRVGDVLILDISMPGRSGLEALKDITKEQPELPVLILSVHPEDLFAIRAFRAGAAGYLTKDSAPKELVTAIRKVVGGGRYISVTLAEKLVLDMATSGDPPLHKSLSDREYEVFRLLAAGRRVSEIAEQLMLSVKTISTYRSRILDKMQMKNNAELMRYAIQHQLVE
jgi:two-component system, NarL family, invasion response regulator UvrY